MTHQPPKQSLVTDRVRSIRSSSRAENASFHRHYCDELTRRRTVPRSTDLIATALVAEQSPSTRFFDGTDFVEGFASEVPSFSWPSCRAIGRNELARFDLSRDGPKITPAPSTCLQKLFIACDSANKAHAKQRRKLTARIQETNNHAAE
jgi:hypothetical protein